MKKIIISVNKIKTNLISTQLLLSLLIQVCILYKLFFIESACMSVLFILSIVTFFISLNKKNYVRNIIIFALLLINFLLSILSSTLRFYQDIFNPFLCFLMMLLPLLYFDDLKYELNIKILKIISVIMTIFYLQLFYLNNINDLKIILNLNTISFFILCNCFTISACIENNDKKNFLYIFLYFINFYLIILAECRTAFLISLFLFIFCFFIKYKKNNRMINYILCLLPILFIIIQIYFSKSQLANYIIFNKPLFTGRNYIYLLSLNNLNNYIFGDVLLYKFSNLHNGILSIFCSMGIMGIIIFYYIWLKKINNIQINNIYNKIGYVGFLCILLYSCTEASSLVAGGAFVYPILIFCIFASERK